MKRILKEVIIILLSGIAAGLFNYYITRDIIGQYVYMRGGLQLPFVIFLLIMQTILAYFLLKLAMDKKKEIISYRILWICYFIVMGTLLLGRPVAFRAYNINPLEIIKDLHTGKAAWVGMFVNISFFVPIGYLFRKQSFAKVIVAMLPVELAIETSQYIFYLGVFDVNDIILNILGVIIGWIAFRVVRRNIRKLKQTK